MGTIYSFISSTKPWVKLGQTTNSPIGRIEDYNDTHGTDFSPESLVSWSVPDSVCLMIEQAVHQALERNHFDRVRKGSANEIFTFAGRQPAEFIEVVILTIRGHLISLLDEVKSNLCAVNVETPPILHIDARGWKIFKCPKCENKLAAPLMTKLEISCPKCCYTFTAKYAADN